MSHVVVGTTVGSLKEVEGRVPLLRQELQVCFNHCVHCLLAHRLLNFAKKASGCRRPCSVCAQSMAAG